MDRKILMKKTTQLKQIISSSDLTFIMEAHNGISAKIVEESGFLGVWGSGLTMSASCGVRDNNELSWTQVLGIAEYICDAVQIPMLLDGDTGYGNFNNMRRLVRKLEQRGVAGVCIEDKLFPKKNSFIRGETQPLAGIQEFCGKIKAGLDSRLDPDFQIVARVEAFIAGWGLDEALKRAEAYHQAGADAILIHSKKQIPDEIISFARRWESRCPLIIVPTKYYATPTEVFRKLGINMVIWANHLLRSAVVAMKETAGNIYKTESLVQCEDNITPVQEIFRLQNDHELQEAEKIYLNTTSSLGSAIILAATRGEAFGELTKDKPKACISIKGKPLVQTTVESIREQGINDISLVCGYKKESFSFLKVNCIENKSYQESEELFSLYMARDKLTNDCLITYGDIIFKKYILSRLLFESRDIILVVDKQIDNRSQNYRGDFVMCDKSPSSRYLEEDYCLKEIAEDKPSSKFHGEWIGLLKTSKKGSQWLVSSLDELAKRKDFRSLKMPDLINHLITQNITLNVLFVEGHWLDIDNLSDIDRGYLF